jgi:hypothetical protein
VKNKRRERTGKRKEERAIRNDLKMVLSETVGKNEKRTKNFSNTFKLDDCSSEEVRDWLSQVYSEQYASECPIVAVYRMHIVDALGLYRTGSGICERRL